MAERREKKRGQDGSCCCINDLANQFDEDYARDELEAYRRDGLGERARRLVTFLEGQGLEGRTVLEIGAGIGALHLEMLKAGAVHAIGVDASPANIAAAQSLAADLGLADRTEKRLGDFTQIEGEVPEADIVLLDRVVCCYPDMEALVGAAARHARTFIGLTYPRRAWWMRWSMRLINLVQTVFRSPYRAYYHEPDRIDATVVSYGFRPVHSSRAGVWDVAVFERR
jgi:magnesium-protoporphyrin O-methyltransferase